MTIKNIVLKQLFDVLKSLPKGTYKIDIEYTENDDESKITIYPSSDKEDEDDEDSTPAIDNKVDDPDISPDEDIINLI